MSHLLPACLLLFPLTIAPVQAQRFNIEASPSAPTVTAGQTVTITISVLPVEGFNATVFLSVSAPQLSPTSVVLSTERLNSPYTPGATLTITPTGGDIGVHTIVIEGRNSSVVTYDTVMLRVRQVPGVDQWTVYHQGNSDLTSLKITAIDFDRTGTAWIGTGGGLLRAAPGETPRWAGPLFRDIPIIALAIDSSDGIVVLTWFGVSRLENGDTVNYPIPDEYWELRADKTAIAVGPDGSIWLGTKHALFRYRENVWTQFTYRDWGDAVGNSVWEIAITSTGDVWASTYGRTPEGGGSGIVKYDGSFWTSFTVHELQIVYPVSSTVDLAIWDADEVWAATWSGIVNPSGSPVLKRTTPSTAGLIAFAPDGQLWAGGNYPPSPEQVLFSQQGDSWQIHPLKDAGLPVGLPGGVLPNQIIIHPNGSVWIGTDDHGLVVLNPGRGTVGIDAPDRPASSRQISITPNPLASFGTIGVSSNGGSTRISLFDNVGRRVAVLYQGELLPGEQSVPVDLSDVAAGAYLLTVDVDGEILMSRMIMVAPR